MVVWTPVNQSTADSIAQSQRRNANAERMRVMEVTVRPGHRKFCRHRVPAPASGPLVFSCSWETEASAENETQVFLKAHPVCMCTHVFCTHLYTCAHMHPLPGPALSVNRARQAGESHEPTVPSGGCLPPPHRGSALLGSAHTSNPRSDNGASPAFASSFSKP